LGLRGDYVDRYVADAAAGPSQDFVLAAVRTAQYDRSPRLPRGGLVLISTWLGSASEERGIDRHSSKTVVRVNRHWYRKAEVDSLIGNPKKAEKF